MPDSNIINLITPSVSDQKLLYQFFSQPAQQCWWEEGTPYSINGNQAIYFSHFILARTRKNQKEGLRYEIISEKLNSGGLSTVYSIAATMAVKEGGVLFRDKQRVLKKQRHGVNNPLYMVKREYILTDQAGYLSVKPPTIFFNTSYLVMKRAKGKELFDLLADNDFQQNFSTEDRLVLSIALLDGLIQQVHDRGLIHCDVKPENIIVDLDSESLPGVTFIDFGGSTLLDDPDSYTRCSATLGYAAPEFYSHTPCSAKSDVFSISRVIRLVIGDRADFGVGERSRARRLSAGVSFKYLFASIKDLSETIQALIIETIGAMSKPVMEERSLPREARAGFLRALSEYAPQSKYLGFFNSSPRAQPLLAPPEESKEEKTPLSYAR